MLYCILYLDIVWNWLLNIQTKIIAVQPLCIFNRVLKITHSRKWMGKKCTSGSIQCIFCRKSNMA